MTELKKENNNARPACGRAFLSRDGKPLYCCLFRGGLVLPDLAAHLIFWPLMVIGIVLDLWTKKAIFNWLLQKPANNIPIIDGFLQLVTAENTGAAFGMAAGQRYLLAVVSGFALIAILGIFLFGGIKQKLIYVALGFFAAGVCGNLWDRIFNDGRVRDFIDVYYRQYHWPAFNIADTMLCIAVGLLIISSLRPSKHSL